MPDNTPRLSIGLPVYNGERFLAESIECMLNQTFSDFEFIISDNASTDGTEEICRKYAAQDRRINYLRNIENKGASWNFNRVVELARGPLYKWMADDDLYDNTFLEKCIDALDHHPDVVLAYPKSDMIDENGDFIKSLNYNFEGMSEKPWVRFRRQITESHGCVHVFGVLRTDIFRATPLLANYVGSDRVLLALLSLYGKFYEVPEHLFFHREHARRSVRAYSDIRMRAAWFDPGKKGKRSYPYWKYLREYGRAISNAPLSFSEKMQCRFQLLRWIKWNYSDLIKDLTYKPPKGTSAQEEPQKIEKGRRTART